MCTTTAPMEALSRMPARINEWGVRGGLEWWWLHWRRAIIVGLEDGDCGGIGTSVWLGTYGGWD